MRKIKIIIDSTSDLGKEVYEKHDIEIVPIYVILGDNTYKDYYEMDTTRMFAYTEETGIYPKTAAASPLWIYKVFKKYYDEGYDIVYTGISSNLSRTFFIA
ncbi:MAG TPA: DegV family protein, partial [Bacilli bacterium]|nr:DegV family protein [Bacilli bacterium]